MALKNHALDGKIVASAQAEFLEKGFRQASMQRIAARAGLTTGALYTRYKSKDELFCSLVKDLMQEAMCDAKPMTEKYSAAQMAKDPVKILEAIREEEKIYQDLLFQHHEACVLMFCKSGGSSIESKINEMMSQKAAQTVEYLKSISQSELDLDGIGMILSEQFHFFREILDRNYDRDKANECIKTVEFFLNAGWQALFEKILKKPSC